MKWKDFSFMFGILLANIFIIKDHLPLWFYWITIIIVGFLFGFCIGRIREYPEDFIDLILKRKDTLLALKEWRLDKAMEFIKKKKLKEEYWKWIKKQ